MLSITTNSHDNLISEKITKKIHNSTCKIIPKTNRINLFNILIMNLNLLLD